MSENIEADEPKRGLSKIGIVIAFLPFVTFLALAGIFWKQLTNGEDPSLVPSVLIGKEAPKLNLAGLPGSDRPALTQAAIKGKLTLVNIWASWCIPCRQEAPGLMELSKDKRLNIVGINYKDKSDNALRFLGDFGNPFDAIGVDPNGAAVIDWGVYGVPESYLVDAKGRIVFKQIGPFDPDSIKNKLMPAIEKAFTTQG